MSDSYEFATHNLSADIMGWPVAKIGDRWRPSVSFPRTWHGIVRLRVQVAQWTDEQPDTELSRLPIPA